MTANKKQRNTPIPVGAIKGAAEKKDNGITMSLLGLQEQNGLQVANSGERDISIGELEKGYISIPAKNNTRTRTGKEERQ